MNKSSQTFFPYLIVTVCTVHTRIRATFIDVYLTVIPIISRLTHTLVISYPIFTSATGFVLFALHERIRSRFQHGHYRIYIVLIFTALDTKKIKVSLVAAFLSVC